VGLDYHKRVLSSTSKDRQHSVFGMLLSLAKKHGKPVIIHSDTPGKTPATSPSVRC